MAPRNLITAFAVTGATALLLAACSSPSTSNEPAGSLGDSSSPTAAAPEAAATEAAAVTPTFNAGGFLYGNAQPNPPAGDSGTVAVVSQAPLKKDSIGGGMVIFTFRNNTSAAVSHVDFTASANVNGQVVGSGQSQGTIPAHVQPGEAGFGYIYFSDASSIPDTGVTYDFKSSTSPADTTSYNTAPLTVTQATNNGSSFIGSATNKTGEPLTGPYSVTIYCFTGDSAVDEITGFAPETGDITADASVTFSVDYYDQTCDSYTVGASGYFQ
jgi:hypothetical protein